MSNNLNAFRNRRVSVKQTQLRNQLWPDFKEEDIWYRKRQKGFTTIPRTMPLILRIMDSLSKGQPVSSTYLDLWARAFDEAFVTLASKQQDMAFAAGFSGQRALQTWSKKIEILEKLGFVRLAEGPAGPKSYVLLLNPHKILKQMHKNNKIGKDQWNALIARATEIGAEDML